MAKTAVTNRKSSLSVKGGLYATNLGYYLLWFEFLAMSPSYELARRYHSDQWSDEDEAKRPPDFDRVLEVYADLGDVQRELFRDWWLNRAFDAFGYKGKRPRVEEIAYIAPFTDSNPHFGDAADRFIKGSWNESGQQRTLIVAIPIGLTRNTISRRINKMLDRYPVENRALLKVTPYYPLQAINLHRHSYFRYLYVFWHRCSFPNDPLWKIGARAKVSKAYSRVDPQIHNGRHDMVDDKYRLKILTHRAIERGKMMAENAARGVFPSYAKCPHAIPFDLEELNMLRRDRRRWQLAERRRRNLITKKHV